MRAKVNATNADNAICDEEFDGRGTDQRRHRGSQVANGGDFEINPAPQQVRPVEMWMKVDQAGTHKALCTLWRRRRNPALETNTAGQRSPSPYLIFFAVSVRPF
jgi:hypothetical protein